MSDPRPSVIALGGLGAAAALFVWMISIGIARYNECGELQGDPKYENRKIFLSQLLTIMITIPATIMAMPILNKMGGDYKSSAPLVGVLMGVAGLVGSVFSYQIVEHDKECTKDTQDKNMAIGGMVLSICLILFGGYKFFKFNPTYFARPIPPITQGTSINNAR
jgi:predicted MFS family arabinose efflux permease